MANFKNMLPMWVPKAFLVEYMKLSSESLQLLKLFPDENQNELNYDLIAVAKRLAEHYKLTKQFASDSGETDTARLKVDIEKEKKLNLQIKNQLALGDLITKDEAKVRISSILSAYREFITLFMNELAVKMAGETRDNEIWMYNKFNELFDKIVKDNADVISWKADGRTSLLTTRILTKDSESSVFEYLKQVQEAYDE